MLRTRCLCEAVVALLAILQERGRGNIYKYTQTSVTTIFYRSVKRCGLKKIILFVLVLVLATCAYASTKKPVYEGAVTLDGGNNDECSAVAVDSDGNMY